MGHSSVSQVAHFAHDDDTIGRKLEPMREILQRSGTNVIQPVQGDVLRLGQSHGRAGLGLVSSSRSVKRVARYSQRREVTRRGYGFRQFGPPCTLVESHFQSHRDT